MAEEVRLIHCCKHQRKTGTSNTERAQKCEQPWLNDIQYFGVLVNIFDCVCGLQIDPMKSKIEQGCMRIRTGVCVEFLFIFLLQ